MSHVCSSQVIINIASTGDYILLYYYNMYTIYIAKGH